MKMRETVSTTSHINTFSRVLTELSSQWINFDEKVKALALLSSLLVNWEVFCPTFANNCPKLNLDKESAKSSQDFDEIFAPVVKMTLIRIVLSITSNMDLEVE